MNDAAQRLKHRDVMRRSRAARICESWDRSAEYELAWGFEAICKAVGLRPSPPSSLDPARWRDVESAFISGYVAALRYRERSPLPRGNNWIFYRDS